jgi:3-isopropylmalate dehydratase small subunit
VGIKCVIAKSFAFIYGRNQPNLGLLGITITDESFYEAAVDGADIDLDLKGRCVYIAGSEWPFELSDMEIALMEAGGITGAFQKFGKALFENLTAPRGTKPKKVAATEGDGCGSLNDLQW